VLLVVAQLLLLLVALAPPLQLQGRETPCRRRLPAWGRGAWQHRPPWRQALLELLLPLVAAWRQ
jgi:hypothetical protein